MNKTILLLAGAAFLASSLEISEVWDCQDDSRPTNDGEDRERDESDNESEEDEAGPCSAANGPREFCKLAKAPRDVVAPEGWRIMTVDDVKDHLAECKESMKAFPWAIVRMIDGKIGGAGYKYEIQNGSHWLNCNPSHTFIQTNHDCVDQVVPTC